jgi:hypothetical protein
VGRLFTDRRETIIVEKIQKEGNEPKIDREKAGKDRRSPVSIDQT